MEYPIVPDCFLLKPVWCCLYGSYQSRFHDDYDRSFLINKKIINRAREAVVPLP